MGGHPIPQSKISLAEKIKDNTTISEYESAVKEMDSNFSKTFTFLQE